MKKHLLSLFALCLMSVGSAYAQSEIVVGDMNDDGTLSIGDVTLLTDAILSDKAPRVISTKCDPNASDPAAIAGYWSTTDNSVLILGADGSATVSSNSAVTSFEYYPFRGDLVLLDAEGYCVQDFHVLRQTPDYLLFVLADGTYVTYYSAATKNFTVKGVNFNVKLVEAGTFLMGSDVAWDVEKPAHSVTISQDYYIGTTEVTQGLWYAITGTSVTDIADANGWGYHGVGDDYPMYNISWVDCQEFITKLNQITGQNFRMPTEAEWEYAAKGGNQSLGYTFCGNNTIDEVAWYMSNSDDTTHPVATKKANELGLYDMSGNVWEWCSDWYGTYSSTAVTDPTGATSGSDRVVRGGSKSSEVPVCRPTYRFYANPTEQFANVGLRLALSVSK